MGWKNWMKKGRRGEFTCNGDPALIVTWKTGNSATSVVEAKGDDNIRRDEGLQISLVCHVGAVLKIACESTDLVGLG